MAEENIQCFTHENKPETQPAPGPSKINLYMITEPKLVPSESAIEEPNVTENAGVFIINPDLTEFKEEPEDIVEEEAEKFQDTEIHSEGEDSENSRLYINESNGSAYSDSFSDVTEDREMDDLNDPHLVAMHSAEAPLKKKTGEPKEPKRCEKYPLSQPRQTQRVKQAFLNYFKGLRSDFEKLTPERKQVFKETLRQMMNEQIDQDC